MPASIRKLLCALVVPLPQPLKRLFFRHVLGWEVARDACVGLSFVHADEVTLEAGSRIGHLNLIRNVRLLHLAPRASIGNFNHVFGPPPWGEFVDRSFRLGEGSLLTSRHFVDVSGRVVIGRNCTIGGRDTHLWSHSLFHSDGVISLSPRSLIIENDVYVGARATLVHSTIPARAVVAAGAVVSKSFAAEEGEALLIAGNPAVVVRRRA